MSDTLGSDEDHVDRRKVLVIGLDGATFSLLEPMAGTGALLSVPEFKKLTGTSRKHAIPLLEYLDRERITRRMGDSRQVVGFKAPGKPAK